MIVTNSALACRVLVLNKHYMAIRIVTVKRAISLLFRNLAEVISVEQGQYYNYDFGSWLEISELRKQFEPTRHDWLNTVKISIAVPRIVRLLAYDRLPKQQLTLNRRNIYARDDHHCQYCGKKFPTTELSLDHIIPRTRGGQATWENLVCSCLKCNVRKGCHTPKEVGMKLVRRPVKPKTSPIVSLTVSDGRYHSWKQFLNHAYWTVQLK